MREWLPQNASAEGVVIDQLLRTSVLVLATLAAVGIVWLLILIVRGRRRQAVMVEAARPWLVPTMVAAGFLLGVDGFLLSRSSGDPGLERDDPRALKIEVNAQQWAWAFRYAGKDEQFATADDVVTTNELHVPIGRRVELALASSDVVHSFHLPNFRVKRDAIPGRVTRVGFTATRPGRFAIACAQFCGVLHYRMSGTLTVSEAAVFEKWLSQGSDDSLRMTREKTRAESEDEVTKEPLFPRARPSFPPRDWGWPWR